MTRYTVTYFETTNRTVQAEVEAESEAEALSKAENGETVAGTEEYLDAGSVTDRACPEIVRKP